MPKHALCASVSALVLFTLPGISLAAADYRVNGTISTTVSPYTSTDATYQDNQGTSNFIEDHANYDDFGPDQPSYHALAVSAAGPDGLHASAHAEIEKITQNDGYYGLSMTSGAYAEAIFDDMIILPPSGSNPSTVSTSYTVHLDGSLTSATNVETDGYPRASSSVQIGFYGNGQNIGGGNYADITSNGTHTTGGEEDLTNFTGSQDVTSPAFTVPVNTPFTIELQLYVTASVDGWENDTWDQIANADFGDTLTFATDVPVFNLPAGYTINSTEAGIQNNTYVAPEPATVAIFFAASALMFRRCRL